METSILLDDFGSLAHKQEVVMEARIKALVDFCRQNGRVCPSPSEWNELYNLLPDCRRKGGGWEPALPLILAAWTESPTLMKWLRVEEHIRWAAGHGALDAVESYLRCLPESKWITQRIRTAKP